jgi:hypothetical protein
MARCLAALSQKGAIWPLKGGAPQCGDRGLGGDHAEVRARQDAVSADGCASVAGRDLAGFLRRPTGRLVPDDVT